MANAGNIEVTFVCPDEKAVFMLKASRMFDGGYRDFIDLGRVEERLGAEADTCFENWIENQKVEEIEKHSAYRWAMEIVKEEVRR